MTVELIILINDDAIKYMKQARMSGKNYNAVVMNLMKIAKFQLKDGRGIDPEILPNINLSAAFADIKDIKLINKAVKDINEHQDGYT
jgi:hypothetical protein